MDEDLLRWVVAFILVVCSPMVQTARRHLAIPPLGRPLAIPLATPPLAVPLAIPSGHPPWPCPLAIPPPSPLDIPSGHPPGHPPWESSESVRRSQNHRFCRSSRAGIQKPRRCLIIPNPNCSKVSAVRLSPPRREAPCVDRGQPPMGWRDRARQSFHRRRAGVVSRCFWAPSGCGKTTLPSASSPGWRPPATGASKSAAAM